MKILITGATGFVGKRVVQQLLEVGEQVVVLTRNTAAAVLRLGNKCEYFQWSHPASELPPEEAFEGVDAIINLMGEGIADKRWSEEQKKKIYDSRILGTRHLIEALEKLEKRPECLISSSAIGIYGDRGQEELTEDSSTADDFLARVCKDWEQEALKAQDLGIRVGLIRTGVVLGQGGGALQKMIPIFKLGGGGPVGNGKQVMSWIHVDDLASMFITLAKDSSLSGIFNGTAPHPSKNKDFTKALGKALKRPAILPAPSFALKIVFGEMSQVLLDGQKVLPQKFNHYKFNYRYPTLEEAFKNIVG